MAPIITIFASGEPYIQDLGSLPFTDTNLNASYDIGEATQNGGFVNQTMGPEGTAFFKVTPPPNVPAWTLWMNGGQQLVGVKKNEVPILFETTTIADRKQNGNLMLVPPYLGLGSDSYFVSVKDDAGAVYSLDSRIQQIQDIAFDSTIPAINATGSPYRVFRVEVPAEQIIWDLNLERLNGDPNICVRKLAVPAETDNDAISEVVGAANDSITLVSPDLTNGTWFITLFGTSPYEANLTSGTPTITDIDYRTEISNDQPNRSGWRYYRVTDITSQLGTLGWQLDLNNAPQGTEIAIRRVQAPGAWKRKVNGSSSATAVRYADLSSTTGILQQVDHEADIWYVGVYQPNEALGNFTLTLSDITSAIGSFDQYQTTVTDQIEGEWRYFRINVPNDPTLLGWYVDLSAVTGTTTAKITIRRDRLAPAPSGSPSVAATSSSWPSGAAWTQDQDFTTVMTNADGKNVTGHRFLAAFGANRPLQSGTYYVGVLAGNPSPPAGVSKTVSYTLRSRGIGGTYAIPVTPLNYAGGTTNLTNLAPRDFRFYSMTIPSGISVPSWELTLSPSVGEMFMQIRRDSLPDYSTSNFVGETPCSGVAGGKRLKRTGAERLVLLPENGQTALQTGTYYAAVVSEGTAPTPSALGVNPTSGTFAASTPKAVNDLGVIGSTPLASPFNLAGGDFAIYRVTVPAGTRLFEVSLTDRVGNPGISMVKGSGVPVPYATSGDNYGWVGGQTLLTTLPSHPVLLSAQDPEAGIYTIVVRAGAVGTNFPSGTGNLRLRVINNFPAIEALGAVRSQVVTDQVAESWRYFTLTIPANAAIKGVYVSLRNVTSGLPRMVIKKGTGLPRDFITTTGLNSDSLAWADGAQWAQTSDFIPAIAKDSSGQSISGRGFLCAYDQPMAAGTYIIGVTKDASINTVTSPATPNMNYTIRVDAVGVGLDYDLATVLPDNSATPLLIPALNERDHRFFKVTIPSGMSSWRLKLDGGLTTDVPPKLRDGMFTIRKDFIPAFDTGASHLSKGGVPVRILNQSDHWVILPNDSSGEIEAGDYYVAVTSLGLNANVNQTGAGSCDLTLTTRGELPSTVISPVLEASETQVNYNLGPAEVAAYEFTVPTRAANLTPYGFTMLISRGLSTSNFSIHLDGPDGITSPTPPGAGTLGFFGGLPILYQSSDATGGQIVYQATPGVYRVIVRSTASGSDYFPASGSLRLRLIDSGTGITELPFDGGNLTVSNVGPITDIIPFRVVVPNEPNWQAWGVRLDGEHSRNSSNTGPPTMTVKRDQPLESSGPTVSVDSEDTSWPTNAQWKQTEDYTKLKNDPFYPVGDVRRDRSEQFFVAARNRPMTPGTYYIGINNRGTPLVSARSFTIRTFAYGTGYTVPVADLSTVGSSANISIPDPRMPSVHKITIPAGVRAWGLSLTPTLGDFTLRVRQGFIPDTVNSLTYPDLQGGVHVQKAGNESFTLLPKLNNDFIPPGDYYIAAVSEGQNSVLATQLIGTGVATATLTNVGPITVAPLGTISAAGISQPVSLNPAEVKFFTVQVPAGVSNLQFRLNDRAGEASIAVLSGERLPAPNLTENYGVFGGQTVPAAQKNKAIVNLSNPTAGIYTIAVRAGGTLPSNYSPASAILSVDILQPAPLNFSATLNAGNGFSHTDSRSLADKQKFFYRVAIPTQIAGQNVLGWLITLDQGSPIVKFYKSETAFGTTAPVTMVGRTALIVPPLLSPGTNWFIEVEGVGTTDYTIRSEPVSLTAAPWTLPANFNQLAGDSNPGQPEGIGAGRDLAQDFWEFYALDVPANNLGLMRIALEASNGNPNIYIQQGSIPTIDHKSTGATGSLLFQYRMIREDSEAGNFSEISNTGLQPDRLKAGTWYIAVKSDPVGATRTSSRYRLKAHSGVVTDINLNTAAPLTAQNLAEKDWRYYRVTIPRTGIPANWLPTFTRSGGTAELYIRDTLPPFSYVNSTSPSTVINDWGNDAKNNVAAGSYKRTPAPGLVTLPVPPVRPGQTYFLGFFGVNNCSFEVLSAASVTPITIDAEMLYNSGSSTFTIQANQKRLIRFNVPLDATRVKFDCAQSVAGLSLKLEQGAPPDTTAGAPAAHFQNLNLPVNLAVNRPLTTAWPFVSKQDYYILLTNTTAAAINSTITMKGVNALTEDEDNDGLADAWERLYFPIAAISTINPGADPDGDGSTNLQEYLNGTNPVDALSVLYSVSLNAPGGTISVSPAQSLFAKNTPITLTATPAAGDTFRSWISTNTSISSSTTNSVSLPIISNITAKAIFQTSLGKSLDTPLSQTWSTSGAGAWYGQYDVNQDGQEAASSPPIGPSTSAEMSTVLQGPGTLGFHWKVSSSLSNRVLTLLLDGVAQSGPISGTTNWASVSLTIPTGNHVVAWRYSKGTGTATGEDRGWVDAVTYTGFQVTPTFTTWKNSNFTTPEAADLAISGPSADPDQDGIANLMEAALGTLPKSANPAGGALKIINNTQSGGNRTIALQSNIAAQGISNITLRLETSPNLAAGNWTILTTKIGDTAWTSQPSTTASEVESGGARNLVDFSEITPSAGSVKRFYRLNAELNP